MGLKEKLIKFMQGRYAAYYGSDSLNKFLTVVFVVELIVFRFFLPFKYSTVIDIFLILAIYYRMFSKNINARYLENQKFLEITSSIRRPMKRIKSNVSDKEYKYIECPNCKQQLRVPRKKGKIKVICKKCSNKFEVRT